MSHRSAFRRIFVALFGAMSLLTLAALTFGKNEEKRSSVGVLECSSENHTTSQQIENSADGTHSNTQTLKHSNTLTLEHSNTRTLEHSITLACIVLLAFAAKRRYDSIPQELRDMARLDGAGVRIVVRLMFRR